MLHSFEAQLQGNQITWLGASPPAVAMPRRVVVVLDDAVQQPAPDTVADILRRAKGAMGQHPREAVLAALEQSRQSWSR